MKKWRAANPETAREQNRQAAQRRRPLITQANRERMARMTPEERKEYWRKVKDRQKEREAKRVVSTM